MGGMTDALLNLGELGLVKIRPNRFDPRRDAEDPYHQVFGWRKSPKLWNIGLQQGFATRQADERVCTDVERVRGRKDIGDGYRIFPDPEVATPTANFDAALRR